MVIHRNGREGYAKEAQRISDSRPSCHGKCRCPPSPTYPLTAPQRGYILGLHKVLPLWFLSALPFAPFAVNAFRLEAP